MHKKLFHIFLSLLSVLGLGSCSDEVLLDGRMSMEGDVPVMFSFEEPADFSGTRGVDEYKRLFEEDDVIHVQGTFTSKTGETGTAYGAMVLKGRKWVPIEGSTLYWPYDAEKGKFKAYYVYNSNYTLTKGNSTMAVNLSDVVDNEDPLQAESEELPYGNAVNMQFTHACTYLTIEKMEPNVTDYFWMVFPGENKIKNAYQLTLNRSGELSLDFISTGDPNENGLIYISRPSENVVDETDGQAYSQASFYLAPGDYYYFDLRTNSNFPFMSFLNSLNAPLEANHPYTLNVVNAKGANFVTDTELTWDEETPPWKVDVEKFLKAANEGNEYSENDGLVPILKKVNGSLVLQRNLDFQNFDGYDRFDFFPDLSTPFDGNLHYIENLGHPLFRFNYSTIQNLGLKNMESTVVAYEGVADNNYANDASRVGGLCMWNRSSGSIRNVRLENFNLTVRVKAEDPQEISTNQTFSIGCLTGENLGTISDVTLKGDFILTATPYGSSGEDYQYIDATMYIGGVVGNLTGPMTNVGPQSGDNFNITITNNSLGNPEYGSGVFCVGGAVGLSIANEISQVVINRVDIIGTSSDGYQQYTGGLAGRLRGSGGTISNCTVQGSLTCGTVSAYGLYASSPLCYMGGLCGNVRGYTVTNCRAVCDVKSNTESIQSDALYATGGVFGRIQSSSVLRNNTAYGSILTGPPNYIGTFAGVSRTDLPWDELEADGNTARSFGDLLPIAFLQDGNDTE